MHLLCQTKFLLLSLFLLDFYFLPKNKKLKKALQVFRILTVLKEKRTKHKLPLPSKSI